MPRNYVRKRVPSYTTTDLDLAIVEVKKGRTIAAVAQQYSIPYETLRRWIVLKPSHKISGRSTTLNVEEENCIVQALKFVAKCGLPFDRQDVINIAQQYVSCNRNIKAESLGIEWARSFEKRWSNELTKRKPELLTNSRAADFSPHVVNNFFEMYARLLSENGLKKAPERIFNLDEIGLGTDSRANKVFVPKKNRIAYLKSPDAGKSMYSVLICTSATGNFLPPFTVYKSLHLYESWTKGGPRGALYGCTESGWMQDTVFETWMGLFIKEVEHLEKPILLIFDGHGSHLTYKTIKQAMDNGIIILCLPPNSSHALQPLDVGVFAPMKCAWRKILKVWYRESRLQKVSKATFPYLLKQLFDTLKGENAIKGFKAAGLYPIDKTAVEHKIVLTEIDGKIIANNVAEPSTSATSGALSKLTSSSTISNFAISSPYKELKQAILTTISPLQSEGTKKALENARRKRKRVQTKIGEVMTTSDVAERLLEEERVRATKKKRNVSNIKSSTQNKAAPQATKNLPKSDSNVDQNVLTSNCKVDLCKITTGNWVVVKYAGKNSIKNFIGQITGMDGKDFIVKYVRKSSIGDYYTFPDNDDTDIVEKHQIINILKEPQLNNRGHYIFPL